MLNNQDFTGRVMVLICAIHFVIVPSAVSQTCLKNLEFEIHQSTYYSFSDTALMDSLDAIQLASLHNSNDRRIYRYCIDDSLYLNAEILWLKEPEHPFDLKNGSPKYEVKKGSVVYSVYPWDSSETTFLESSAFKLEPWEVVQFGKTPSFTDLSFSERLDWISEGFATWEDSEHRFLAFNDTFEFYFDPVHRIVEYRRYDQDTLIWAQTYEYINGTSGILVPFRTTERWFYTWDNSTRYQHVSEEIYQTYQLLSGDTLLVDHKLELTTTPEPEMRIDAYLLPEHHTPRIRVYPNPTSSQATIQILDHDAGSYNVTISNLTGLVLLEKRVKVQEFTLDIEFLSTGVYLITAETDREKFSCSILKQ